MKQFVSSLRAGFVLVTVMSLLVGVIYPLVVTAFAQLMFHHKANGSLIERGDRVVGSGLLGQSFDEPKYFWGRLSATTPPYNAAASGGSNLSPANPKLLDAVNQRMAALQKADPANKKPVPVDLVSASGSGLDPHISLLAAEYQLPRVARARHMKESDVQALIERHTENDSGLLGDAYVNVLRLNMTLDEEQGSGFGTQDSGKK